MSANFAYLANDIEMINGSEADWVHVDIMDGVFVPNISFGFPVLKYVAKLAAAGKVHPGSKGVGGTYNERAL